MTTCTQASYIGTEVVIQCGGKMTCCEREQSKAKVEAYNSEIAAPDQPGPLQIAGPGDAVGLEGVKAAAQKRAARRLRKDMKGKSPADQKAAAKAHGASNCFADEMVDNNAKFEMDHPVDAKWGGEAVIDAFIPLSPAVNNLFGQITQKIGDQMHGRGKVEITAVVFDCPGPCSPSPPPSQDYSTGTRSQSGPLCPGMTSTQL